jgi:hypothetical protein
MNIVWKYNKTWGLKHKYAEGLTINTKTGNREGFFYKMAMSLILSCLFPSSLWEFFFTDLSLSPQMVDLLYGSLKLIFLKDKGGTMLTSSARLSSSGAVASRPRRWTTTCYKCQSGAAMAEHEGRQPSGGTKTGGWRTSSPVLPCPHAPASQCARVVARLGTKGARVVTLQMGHRWASTYPLTGHFSRIRTWESIW